MQPWHIALLICLLPIVAAHGAYLISIHQELVPVCVPYIEGCVSISRAARVGDGIFLFRGLMMPAAALLPLFWWCQYHWLNRLQQNKTRRHRIMLVVGSVGALFLLLYANFLGSSGEIYNLLRRFGVTLYFAFTALAQLMALHTATAQGHALPRAHYTLVRWQFYLTAVIWGMGLVHVVAKALMSPELQDLFENAVEWHFALYMTVYFGLQAFIWRQQQFRWTFHG